MDAVGDLYALLGVSPTVSQEDIRKAYRTVASRFHPDVNNSPAAALIFKEISAAYEILNSPSSREEYDRTTIEKPAQGIVLSTLISRDAVPRLDERQLVYAMVKLAPPGGVAVTGGQTPINLALVLDRSTSMKGPRLQQVKAATNLLVDSMADEDILSVVAFSDDADVLIEATRPYDRRHMKATVTTMMRAGGATSMYAGLLAGMQELSKHLHARHLNHLILITDGRTYGDEDACLELAEQARDEGITINTMGMGEDWNDEFLDDLASRTGGTSMYVAQHQQVRGFVEGRVRALGTAFAERTRLIVAPSPSTSLASVFRATPDPMPLDANAQPIPLGIVDAHAATSLILQFGVNGGQEVGDELLIGRVLVYADILGGQGTHMAVADVSVKMAESPREQRVPGELLEALSQVTLYRMQERARSAFEVGDAQEASRRLEMLATRLFERGEESLGHAALTEAKRVAETQAISMEGQKVLKFGTRGLVSPEESSPQ